MRPGAGYVGDRLFISQFTCEDEAKLDGFSDNSPDCMVNDQIKCEQFLEESSWGGCMTLLSNGNHPEKRTVDS